MPDLKPCQAGAKETIRWRTDYETQKRIGRIDCKECDRHAEILLDMYTMSECTAEHARGRLFYGLCKGCKEAETNADGV